MDRTLKYYAENVESFVNGTVVVDFSATQNKFLSKLNPGAHILDFGCGSGRDTKYFIDKGFDVIATDGSKELCEFASEFTGIEVRQMLFQELSEVDEYDGIWACSSILHLPKIELKPVIKRMLLALHQNGVIYTSFKYSEFEGERNGRYFTDFTLEGFTEYISDIYDMAIEEYWITGDVRPGREEEKWLNFILRKTNS